LMVGVLYKKRALPIAWLVYKGKRGHTTAQRHIQVLEKVLPLLPEGVEVVLLGDAEYDTTEMIVWVEKHPLGTMFYALRPRFMPAKGKTANPLGITHCQKGMCSSAVRSVLPSQP